MTGERAQRIPSRPQRNALASGLIATAILFLAPVLMQSGWAPLVLFAASIFAVIVAWFAFQARRGWWIPVFIAIAVVWNPIFPFPASGWVWLVAQPDAAVLFLISGGLVKVALE